MKRILRLWRRACCRRGHHRETVETTGASLLRCRCVDCDASHPLGWVFTVTNKPRHRSDA